MAEILHNLKGGNVRSNVVVQPASVVLNSSETLDAGTYSGRVLVVNDTAGSDRTFTLDDPEKPGIRYNFVYGGDAASGHDIVIAAESSTTLMYGSITYISTDTGFSTGVMPNGTTHDELRINVPSGFDITVTSNSNTHWHVSGTVSGTVAPAFET